MSVGLNSPGSSVSGTARHEVRSTDMNGEDLRKGEKEKKVGGEQREERTLDATGASLTFGIAFPSERWRTFRRVLTPMTLRSEFQ